MGNNQVLWDKFLVQVYNHNHNHHHHHHRNHHNLLMVNQEDNFRLEKMQGLYIYVLCYYVKFLKLLMIFKLFFIIITTINVDGFFISVCSYFV